MNEHTVRDQMLREYGTDDDLAHRALQEAGAGTRSSARPEMLNRGTPIAENCHDDVYDAKNITRQKEFYKEQKKHTKQISKQ